MLELSSVRQSDFQVSCVLASCTPQGTGGRIVLLSVMWTLPSLQHRKGSRCGRLTGGAVTMVTAPHAPLNSVQCSEGL